MQPENVQLEMLKGKDGNVSINSTEIKENDVSFGREEKSIGIQLGIEPGTFRLLVERWTHGRSRSGSLIVCI